MYHQPTIFCFFFCRDLRLAMVFGPSDRGTVGRSLLSCDCPRSGRTDDAFDQLFSVNKHAACSGARGLDGDGMNFLEQAPQLCFASRFFRFDIVSMLFGIPEVTNVFQDKLKQATASKISTKISCRCDGPSIIQILCDPFPSSCFGVGELHGHPGLRLQAKLG